MGNRLQYACMPVAVRRQGDLAIETVQPEDIEPIRQWRNAQLDVLRQRAPITPEQQVRYYAESIWPTLATARPANILVRYAEGDRLVGYGGLVHVEWEQRRAEVSFLLDPVLTQDATTYRHYHLEFLQLIKRMAFEDLGFEVLHTETYPQRVHHLHNLELAGFERRAVGGGDADASASTGGSIFHVCCRRGDG